MGESIRQVPSRDVGWKTLTLIESQMIRAGGDLCSHLWQFLSYVGGSSLKILSDLP